MLVVLAVSGVVFAGVYTSLDSGLRVHAVGAARVESQQAARVALNRIAREIRITGVGASADFPAVAVADPARIVLASDLDGDGGIAARGERITWHLDGSTLRRDAGGGAQPIADGVEQFTVRYFDAHGLPTADPAAVRAVEVTIRAANPGPPSTLTRGASTQLSTTIRLRNR